MSAAIDPQLVRHVGKLARIQLTDRQVELFSRQLSQILDYFQQLNELNVDGVEPLAHPLDVSNVFRDDVPGASLPPETALREAPARDGRFFLVPRVLGEE